MTEQFKVFPPENRLKILRVSVREIANLVIGTRHHSGAPMYRTLCPSVGDSLPPDAVLLNVSPQVIGGMCYEFYFYHPSWPVVQPGEVPPPIEGDDSLLRWVKYVVDVPEGKDLCEFIALPETFSRSAAMMTMQCLRNSRRDEENGPTLDREWASLERMILALLNRVEQVTKAGMEMADDLRSGYYVESVRRWDELVSQVAKEGYKS